MLPQHYEGQEAHYRLHLDCAIMLAAVTTVGYGHRSVVCLSVTKLYCGTHGRCKMLRVVRIVVPHVRNALYFWQKVRAL